MPQGNGAIRGPSEAMSIRPCRYGGVFSFRRGSQAPLRCSGIQIFYMAVDGCGKSRLRVDFSPLPFLAGGPKHIGAVDWPLTLFRGFAPSALSIDLMTDRAKNLQPPGSSSAVYDVPAGKPVRSCALLSCCQVPPGGKAGAGGPRGALHTTPASAGLLFAYKVLAG